MGFLALRWLGFATLLIAASAHAQPFTSAKAMPKVEVEWKSSLSQSDSVIRPVSAQVEPLRLPDPGTAKETPLLAPEPIPVKTEPPCTDEQRGLPINLATAMQLANARPIDVQVAARQVQIAVAQFDRVKVLWAPNLTGGMDYFRHDGAFQSTSGDLSSNSRSSFMAGGGANAVFGINDAIFSPLASRQDLRARRANLQTVSNDTVLAVAEAYFNVQQARGELAGAIDYVKQADELVRRTKQLAEGLAPPMEATRARVELARRQQAVSALRERWTVASAELLRLLRLDPSAIVEPVEPVNLTVQLVEPTHTLDDLIAIGLVSRPELAANQALVKATLQRLRQEKLRPLVPSVLLRSVSTNPTGSMAIGSFGGGTNGSIGNFRTRFDYDLQVVWELQNFGFGNKARIDERKAEREIALLELFRVQDRIAAEISQAFAQVKSAGERLASAEPATKDALDSMQKNMEGLAQTRRVGNVLFLVVRPLEVVAALQALAQANSDYYAAVADFNRAQFRLYRALGHPAQCLPNLPGK